MFCQVKALNPGHTGAWRAGRFFPNGKAVRFEVIEDAAAGKGDANGNGPLAEDGTLDMTRITRSGFEAIGRDDRFSTLADADTSESLAGKVTEAVKAQASRLATELQDERAKNAQLVAENDKLRGELAAAKGGAKASDVDADDGKADGKGPKPKGDKGK